MIKIFTSMSILFFLSGCLLEEQKENLKNNRIELGNIEINYYSDKSVTSLEVPPDLTKPIYENAFRVEQIAKGVSSNTINLTNKADEVDLEKNKILDIVSNIQVKKSGNRRWLIVDKSPDIAWDLSQNFLKENGFSIKKNNKKIGVMETDYLENKPVIPKKSLGFFRSFLASNIENVSYTLPSVDKYTIRIEPLDSNTKSEIHLSLSSMAEVITGSGSNESTLWQTKEKDYSLEAEMLYSLMLYLGGDSSKAREKIINAKEDKIVKVVVEDGINGYAKLVFNLDLLETWDNLSWAISEIQVELEDKDIKERAFYINTARNSDKGLMTTIFGEDAVLKPYQILLKKIKPNLTEAYFNDISEENESNTKKFSYELFNKIQKLF